MTKTSNRLSRTTLKLIIARVVGFALLLFVAILFVLVRQPSPAITVRHVKSVQSEHVTTMTFEIKNHTADPYIFHPFEVQVRNESAWTKFQGFDITKIHPHPTLDPGGVASYTLNVTNLPAGSVVRFSIRPQKVLLGVSGFVRRAELEVKRQANGGRGGGGGISLNPYDRNSKVFGLPTEVVSEEFVEQGPQ